MSGIDSDGLKDILYDFFDIYIMPNMVTSNFASKIGLFKLSESLISNNSDLFRDEMISADLHNVWMRIVKTYVSYYMEKKLGPIVTDIILLYQEDIKVEDLYQKLFDNPEHIYVDLNQDMPYYVKYGKLDESIYTKFDLTDDNNEKHKMKLDFFIENSILSINDLKVKMFQHYNVDYRQDVEIVNDIINYNMNLRPDIDVDTRVLILYNKYKSSIENLVIYRAIDNFQYKNCQNIYEYYDCVLFENTISNIIRLFEKDLQYNIDLLMDRDLTNIYSNILEDDKLVSFARVARNLDFGIKPWVITLSSKIALNIIIEEKLDVLIEQRSRRLDRLRELEGEIENIRNDIHDGEIENIRNDIHDGYDVNEFERMIVINYDDKYDLFEELKGLTSLKTLRNNIHSIKLTTVIQNEALINKTKNILIIAIFDFIVDNEVYTNQINELLKRSLLRTSNFIEQRIDDKVQFKIEDEFEYYHIITSILNDQNVLAHYVGVETTPDIEFVYDERCTICLKENTLN